MISYRNSNLNLIGDYLDLYNSVLKNIIKILII